MEHQTGQIERAQLALLRSMHDQLTDALQMLPLREYPVNLQLEIVSGTKMLFIINSWDWCYLQPILDRLQAYTLEKIIETERRIKDLKTLVGGDSDQEV